MHSANKIADLVLHEASKLGRSLTPMQLIKTVYICHGWMLGVHGKALVSDEPQAWDYGPAYPILYQKLKPFRSSPIKAPESLDLTTFNVTEKALVTAVVEHYSKYSGIELSMMTHQQDTPWDITRKGGREKRIYIK